ncbi:hypothetical protein M0638_24420 [Roseomonas sp. NAR14]|uniref:Lipoprotein n=1 Tax=Roseomonas acroporae TaxID=2937791 RepID=A0A9X1YCB1_9PROT|nr:hypothetical protein [Roseomonas acroporae]MCK8787521.1 hypothetical protein [Roseomonas acroporae]
MIPQPRIRVRSRAVLLAMILPALPGCTSWVRPGATPAMRDAAIARCEAVGYANIPPNMVSYQSGGGYTTPRERRCRTDGNGVERCTTTGGEYRPPTYSTRDTNKPAREAIFRDCMYRDGWHEE